MQEATNILLEKVQTLSWHYLEIQRGKINDNKNKMLHISTIIYFRSLIFHISPIVQGSIKILLTISEKLHHHDLIVTAPGYTESEHTSLLLDLTQHNTYSQYHLFIQNVTNNLVKLSLTGDTLGPLLLNEVKTSVRAFKAKY